MFEIQENAGLRGTMSHRVSRVRGAFLLSRQSPPKSCSIPSITLHSPLRTLSDSRSSSLSVTEFAREDGNITRIARITRNSLIACG